MDLVDEQNGAGIVLDLLHHGLEPLLEVAAIAGPGEQRAHVERKDGRVLQHLRHFAANDLAGQAFCDRRLADAWITDEQRIVLLAPAQHLNGTQHLGFAPDQRVDAAVACFLVEVHAVRVQRIRILLLLGPAAFVAAFLVDATHRSRLGHASALGNAMAHVLHGIEARHVLLLQEERGMALALGEDGDQDVGTRHLLAAGRLHMHDGAMHHALKAGGRGRLGMPFDDQPLQLLVEVIRHAAAQRIHLDVAGAHDGRRIAIVQEREQQMLERCVLMIAFVGIFERPMQRRFQAF